MVALWVKCWCLRRGHRVQCLTRENWVTVSNPSLVIGIDIEKSIFFSDFYKSMWKRDRYFLSIWKWDRSFQLIFRKIEQMKKMTLFWFDIFRYRSIDLFFISIKNIDLFFISIKNIDFSILIDSFLYFTCIFERKKFTKKSNNKPYKIFAFWFYARF